jgi:hypothetical protein
VITLPDLWNAGICGRLGNQLFEVAAAYAHSLRTGHELVIPAGSLVAPLIAGPLKQVPREQLPRPTMAWREPRFPYTPLPMPRSSEEVLALHGYFQSWRYWGEVEQRVWNLFHPGRKLYLEAKEAMQNLLGDPNEIVVAVGVRRGDYVEKQNYHPLQPLSYYEAAAAMFPGTDSFLVFSDDIPWCREHLKLRNVKFCEEKDHWKKLWMQSFCDHHIIANSSYHWWGAFFNQKPLKQVVAPANGRWFGPSSGIQFLTYDLVPLQWQRI